MKGRPAGRRATRGAAPRIEQWGAREDARNRRADAELIGELRRFARGEGFDEQPMPGLDSEALDFRAASESFAAHRKLARRDLETLRLAVHPPVGIRFPEE